MKHNVTEHTEDKTEDNKPRIVEHITCKLKEVEGCTVEEFRIKHIAELCREHTAKDENN